VTTLHADFLRRQLPIESNVGVKDAIIDFCATLQLDCHFDVS